MGRVSGRGHWKDGGDTRLENLNERMAGANGHRFDNGTSANTGRAGSEKLSGRCDWFGSDEHAPPSRLVVLCADQVQHVYELRVAVWIAREIAKGFGSLEGENGRYGVEWGLVEEEYGPVFEVSLSAVGEHEVGEEAIGWRSVAGVGREVSGLTPRQSRAAGETGR